MSSPVPSVCATGCAEPPGVRGVLIDMKPGAAVASALGRQSGAAMVMGMILLVLLTLLGLTAMGTSVMEERMAANARDRIRAFQAAEAALRFCESAVTPTAVFNNSNGLYQPAAAGTAPRWETVDWKSDTAVQKYPVKLPLIDDVNKPRCIAEDLGVVVKESLRVGGPTAPSYGYYRVTARGLGASDKTVVMLQTTLKLEK